MAWLAQARSSLVGRLVVLAAAWSLAVLAAAGLALSIFFSQAEIARFDTEISHTVDGLEAGAVVYNGSIIEPPAGDSPYARAFSGFYWQIVVPAASGQEQMVRSRSLWDHVLAAPPGVLAQLAKSPGDTVYFDAAGPLKQPLRVAAMQVRLADIPSPVIFMAAEDRTGINHEIRTFDATIVIALVLLGAGLIAAVIVQVRVGLGPLFALQNEVAAVRTGDAERITGVYPSELAPLAQELNALMTHTQEVVERQRTHVGNLAHALKTPLSVLITEAAQQPGPLADVVTRQAQAMGQHVDHHLRRARAEARTQGQGERTQVAPVLEDLSRTLQKIFRGRDLSVDWECSDDLAFHGERQDLLEIAGNVMENACKWAVGRVRVEAEAESGRQLRLTVQDDGPGLPEGQRERVLKRGARLDERTPGTGLGLSIVDELTRAYGGTLVLGSSRLGGLKVDIFLPGAES